MQASFMERSNGSKRGLDSSSAEEGQPERKRPALASVIVEALKVDSLQRLCSSLEPILRRVVSEEVERALAKLAPATLTGRSPPKCIEGSDGRSLQLHFKSKLPLSLFTGAKVEGEHGAAIHVILMDSNTRHIVTSGPESSAKLDIVVLEGDFNNEDDESWTLEEFETHVVKEREGKRPLLTGDLSVTLKEGVGTLGDFTFTDNSSWIRSRKFRLGLKVASGHCEGIHIREAKTDAFTVKDHRGELYKKHYPPAPNDNVWRLEKIGKDGPFHKKLNKAGINTVEDFLRLVVTDSHRLRNILGSGMSNKMWEVLVEHAKTCVLGGKLYVYYHDGSRNVGVVFNRIYEFSGLIANGQYHSADSLSGTQKVQVDTLVKKAYENWVHVMEYDGESLLGFLQNKGTDSYQADVPIVQQNYLNSFEQQISPPTLPIPVASEQPSADPGLTVAGYNDSIPSRFANLNAEIQLDGTSLSLQNPFVDFPQQAPLPRNDSALALGLPPSSSDYNQDANSTATYDRGVEDFFSEEIRTRSHEMLENEDMQHLLRMFSMGGQGHHASSFNVTEDTFSFPNPLLADSSQNLNFDDERTRSSGRAVVGWLKLKAALRWGIFVRKKAAERRAQLVELDD